MPAGVRLSGSRLQEKANGQDSHRRGFWPAWSRAHPALARPAVRVRAHVLDGLRSACVPMCVVREWPVVKPFPHTSQPYGRSPVWMRACARSCLRCRKALRQTVHAKGLAPVWVSM